MAETPERVSMKLLDAGEHKDRVRRILSKMKDTNMLPEQLVSDTPCIIATNVPRSLAEKTQGLLEKAGAIILLEPEEKVVVSSEHPRPAPEQTETAPPQEDTPAPSEKYDLYQQSLQKYIATKQYRKTAPKPVKRGILLFLILMVMGLGWGLLGVSIDIPIILNVLDSKNLKQFGIPSQATVIRRSGKKGKGHGPHVTYQFEVLMPDNTPQTFTKTQRVGKGFYKNVKLHESIAILYAQENPKVSMIQGQTSDMEMRLDLAISVIIGTIFGVMGILMVVGAPKKVITDNVLIHRLQHAGQVTTAKIIDRWPKDKRHFYIAYQFEVALGPGFPKQKFGKHIILKARQNAYPLGGTLSIRYLPTDSRIFILDQ